MMSGGDVEARKLGEKLLLDVEVEGLNEVLSSLRTLESEHGTNTTPFGIPELDALIPSSSPTILELVSPAPIQHPSGAGKTSLLYLIIALAILPSAFPSIPSLGGHNAAVILIDPLHHFNIPRLASVILNLLTTHLGVSSSTLDPSIKAELTHLTHRSLSHLHIFHPSSWASLLATLDSLPNFLFNPTAHKSTHRTIHSLILEDIDSFTPSLRAPSTSETATANPLTPPSRALTTSLTHLHRLLSCNIVLTSPSVLPSVFRPALPVSWPGISVVRLGVRRVEVLRFAPEMGVEQARAEGAQRWDVVRRGRFEVWRVGGGNAVEGGGFVFRVGACGVEVEKG